MPERTFFLSDLHIGNGDPECLYQARYHEAGLRAVLAHMQSRSREIRDLVLLGDIFDPLAVPPDRRPFTVAEAIEANHGVFQERRDGGGDFITLLGSMKGTATFINGNHDQFISVDALNAVLEKRCGRRLAGLSDPVANTTFRAGNILAEHGHGHSLLFRPAAHRRVDDPPFGSYISRLLALVCSQKLAEEGKSSAPELVGAGEPVLNIGTTVFAAKELLELAFGAEDLAEALLDQFLFFAGAEKKNFSFILEDGSRKDASAIPAAYKDLWRSAGEDLKYLLVDVTNSLQKDAEDHIAEDAPIVVMGHTHAPLLFADHFPREGVYANSGFLCQDLAELASGEKFPTFVEIEHRWGRDLVFLKRVDPLGRISVLNSVEYSTRR